MNNFNKKIEDEKKAVELETIKLKLKMVSKSSKISQPSVDEYIKNILGSGLKLQRPQKAQCRSVDNVQHNDIIFKNDNFNQSCHLQSQKINGYNSSQNLPFIYQDVISTVELSIYELNTQKIYEIFITSGLGQDILGSIWSVINRTSPGILTREELIVGLAMIAICQEKSVNKGSLHVQVPSWEYVTSLIDLPVPRISITKHVLTKEDRFHTERISQCLDNTLTESVQSTFSDNNEEWADFTVFSEETTVGCVEKKQSDQIQAPINNRNSHVPPKTSKPERIYPSIDIYQEIKNQFSDWQNNIHADKSNSINKLDVNSCSPGNGLEIKDQNVIVQDLYKAENNSSLLTTTDNDFGDFQIFSSNRFEDCDHKSNSSNVDRYELFNCEIKGPCDNLIDQWIRCLTQSLQILFSTVAVLKQVEDEMVKVDVFNSDKGSILLKGIIEVYRVTRNIKLSASRSNILTSSKSMLTLLSDLEKYWNEFMLIIPDDMQIDVQSQLSRCSYDNDSYDDSSVSNCCGVCLCQLNHDDGFLSHGLHKYHCPCANLWVNTLDLTLPGLTRPLSVL